MSNAAVNWALQQRASTSSAKFVLVVLANVVRDKPHVSGSTGKTWPENHAYLSIASICQATGQDKKTVMAGLNRLVSEGLIARAGTDGQTNQVGVFQLLMTSTKNGTTATPKTGTGAGAENGTGAGSGTVPIFPDTSTVFPGHQYQISPSPVPKTGDEPVLNPVEPNKKPKGERAHETLIPETFCVSDRVKAWAKAKGYQHLDEHFEHFAGRARAKGYRYANWDEALMSAIRSDWAKLNAAAGARANGGESIENTWRNTDHVAAL